MDIRLDRFEGRDYQENFIKAFEEKKVKKFLSVWPRRCLSGDTHITMSDGSWKLLRDLNIGDEIISWNGAAFVSDTIKNKWSTGVKKTKRLQSRGYLPIIVSSDHKFATLMHGYDKVSWTNADSMAKRRQVLNYGGLPFGTLHDPDLAEFIGYMITDGYCSGYQQPKFTNANIDILKRVEYLSRKLFGYNPIWRKKGNAYDLGLTNGTKGGGKTKNKVKELFRQYGLDVSKEKRRVLPIVWDFDEESLGRFFAAVVSSDGSIYGHKEGFVGDRERSIPPANEIGISCGLSSNMAWDFYWLLRKVGIIPQVPRRDKGSNWIVKVSKGYGVKWILSNGPIFGKVDKQQFILSRLPKIPVTPSKWNGCYRCKQSVQDFGEEELFDIETECHHNFVANGYVVHNSGKDVCMWNLLIREALKIKANYWYIFPTQVQARLAIWESITNSGETFFDYIPPEVIDKKNDSVMRLKLINGSIIRMVGSDKPDSLRGPNPKGIIFSEYSIQKESVYHTLQPIIAANDGWMVFISTPSGKNFFYDMFNSAVKSDNWWCEYLTLDNTKHVSKELLEQEIADGNMTHEKVQAEYYCSWDRGVEGSMYGTNMVIAERDGRLGHMPYNKLHPVHTAWDIGFTDHTAIIFWQYIDGTIRIIDFFEKNKEPIEFYIKHIKSQEYVYGRHFAPHDMRNSSFSTGLTRFEQALRLGVRFDIVPEINIFDRHDACRRTFNRVWIDGEKGKDLIKSLQNYRLKWDPDLQEYGKPVRDRFKHAADAFGMLCLSVGNVSGEGRLTAEQIEKNYQEAMGRPSQDHMPPIFRTDLPQYKPR